jgi:hypothetical protein
VGLSCEEPTAANTRFAAPNKLFDYIQARIPVIVTPLPVLAATTRTHQVGWVLADHTPEALAAAMREAIAQPDLRNHYQANTHAAAEKLCWESQDAELRALYG